MCVVSFLMIVYELSLLPALLPLPPYHLGGNLYYYYLSDKQHTESRGCSAKQKAYWSLSLVKSDYI